MVFSTRVNTKYLKSCLENLTSEQFEEAIHYLMNIIDPDEYVSTRLSKDEGIDGFKCYRKKNEIEYDIFSIHTRRPCPSKESKKAKMKKDFENALKFFDSMENISEKNNV
ncbi:hypothetical protein ACH0BF_24045 [Pseudobacillus sp. 179-B 2D1 NHS]|uniref:hypothetical protein n=1 Tax=Pseudobacillus sp. 179-B 2D1 NHS TaxID=3374292 RepID=UPI00387A41E7